MMLDFFDYIVKEANCVERTDNPELIQGIKNLAPGQYLPVPKKEFKKFGDLWTLIKIVRNYINVEKKKKNPEEYASYKLEFAESQENYAVVRVR